MGSILIVDDNEDLCFSLAGVVKKQGFSVATAATGRQALALAHCSIIDLVFLDIGLPDAHGISLIARFRETSPDIGIVMLTGMNDAKTAVEALKAGALDYIVKPFDLIEFTTVLKRLMQSRLMEKKAALERQEADSESLIGQCEAMRQVHQSILTAAAVDAPVLITGETGTGKEMVARSIHNSRQRQNGVFVKVDCGTLSANLIESELFGYEQGAFTDARVAKKGLVEMASGGTLFLDEIGNLPIELQPKLLRLIEESTFRKVGGLKDITVQVRIIAATNSDLKEEIAGGSFREDLFYRLNVLPLPLPPLRERGDDILLLADFFLHRLNQEMKKNIKGFSDSAAQALRRYHWPGNIRELRNLLEREVIFNRSGWLSIPGLCRNRVDWPSEATDDLMTLKEAERRHIQHVLRKTGNNKSHAARILAISRTTLRQKLTETDPEK
ncbi:sigma-54-dependent transcriptional regulator [Desulfofustis glycolicus]|uniref:DNA-binding transcriptional response regulator, NtrC family, contains REC, AAA-type ATPase, and a Fis-type DNA-binding domains n=1 Tax=Desulfofustis glycolicus DSM 9705 TaxID=1121409 RepID=A0A1M5VH68_9BACT|nr:sigma-54 dependent transcriptional regulator [Desulfofustis glycolicus]MCB2217579.1 sigma-54 dependent transcriptional regulator [Desulfobulbaceae bacterium]SHH74525.1 DNA-binding transcriptional response regulator, NtrC family, contains REC, AAA-type ATPase, and a Fis-type DNA-binding domains [Desulfofustis glycolicus DSM 9705]